jgi:hypothetical protein
MEYFLFDYAKVKTEKNFQNYENFISNNAIYKHYMFDLALLQHDKDVPAEHRDKAKNILFFHKALFFVPYPFIGFYLLMKKRNNFFVTNLYYQERQLFFKLFSILLGQRILQKALIKYQGDGILPKIKKDYKQHIN